MSNRVLIVILGETRSWEKSFNSFRANLLNPLNADLALCVGDNERENIDNPYYLNSKYVWKLHEPEDWGGFIEDLIKTKFPGLNSEFRDLYKLQNQFLGGIKESGHPGSAGILLCFRHFLVSKLLELDLLSHYDYFVVTRSDYIYTHSHPGIDLFRKDRILVPDGEGYGGITDRHMVIPSAYLVPCLDILNNVFSNFRENLNRLEELQDLNLEKLLKWNLVKNNLWKNVIFFPYIFYTIRLENGHTTWSHGVFSPLKKCFIKYNSEFVRAIYFKYSFFFRSKWTKKMMQNKFKENRWISYLVDIEIRGLKKFLIDKVSKIF
jgi:hypothetical protein